MGGPVDYSTTANNNTSVGGVSIAEGMVPGNVNNGMRAMMADTRKWQLDWSGLTTAGTSDAYTVTSNQGISAYADGMRFSIRADRNNTGAATLNVDGRGAKALRKAAGGSLVALVADDLVAEGVYDVVYDVSSDVFVVVGNAPPSVSPFAETLLDDADAAAARTTLGVRIGTDVQAYNANLASLSGLTLTAGDLLYATGANTLVTLTKGTAGQVLQMNGGATAPEWGGGGRTLLATKTASGSATLSFTEFNNATYRLYEFELQNVKPATDGVNLLFRTSTNGGSSYDAGASDYAWGMNGTAQAGDRTPINDSAASIPLTDPSFGVGNAAAEYGVTGRITLFGAPNAVPSELNGMINYWTDAGGFARYSVAGTRVAAADVDAVRFAFNSGNIASGTIRMFGIA